MKKLLLAVAGLMVFTSGSIFGQNLMSMIRTLPYEQGPLAPVMESNSVQGTRATNTMVFSYAGDPYTAYRYSDQAKDVVCYTATEITSNDLSLFIDNKISAITVCGGINTSYNKNPDRNITLFITKDLKSTPLYEQAAQISTGAFEKNTIQLTTPYELTDSDPLYVGFYFTASNLTQYFNVVDGVVTSANNNIIAFGDGSKVPQTWTNNAGETGSACIYLTLTGDNLPQTLLSPISTDVPGVVSPGTPVKFILNMSNRGASAITNALFKIEVEGEDAYELPVTFDSPIANNVTTSVQFNGNAMTSEGTKNYKLTVLKVNDQDNGREGMFVEGTIRCTSTTFPRNAVVEEATGTWCGYCPRGIVMMEYLKERYDENVFRIAVHTGDQMAIAGYNGWLNGIDGVPFAAFNRTTPIDDMLNKTYLDNMIKSVVNFQTFIKIESPTATLLNGNSKARFDVYVESSVDIQKQYLVALAIVEDGVGPYDQTNYYSGGNYGPCGGWENKGSKVRMEYEDVARALSSYPGNSGLPSKLTKGETYWLPIEVDLSKVSGSQYRLISMLIDAETGEIVNASQMDRSKSAVTTINNQSEPSIITGKGTIDVNGANEVAIYSINGTLIGNGSQSGLAAGIYVVKADSKVMKVIVK